MGRVIIKYIINAFYVRFGDAWFAVLLFIQLLIAILLIAPGQLNFENFGGTLGLAAPLILAACANFPVILAGRGGIDLSVGPLMGIVNVILVQIFIINLNMDSIYILLPATLFIGVLSGLINGFITVIIRVPPIVATLGTYLVYSGLAIVIMPSPAGSIPKWIEIIGEEYSWIPISAVILIWWGIKKLPLYGQLYGIGNDDRSAYTAGVNVNKVRCLAYIITGIFASIAGLALTSLLASADPQIGVSYTLTSIAAIALGGISLAGGGGTLLGAIFGALNIFLIQNLVTHFDFSPFFLKIIYGLVLVIAVLMNTKTIINKIIPNKENRA